MAYQFPTRLKFSTEKLKAGKEFEVKAAIQTKTAEELTWVTFKSKVKQHAMEGAIQGIILKAVDAPGNSPSVDVERTNVWLTLASEPPADPRFPSTSREVNGLYFTVALNGNARTRAAVAVQQEQEEEGEVYAMMFKWTNSDGGHYFRLVDKDERDEQWVIDFKIFPLCERCDKKQKTSA